MKISARLPFALVYLCFVGTFGVSNSARAGSATWDLNPSSTDWNTAANWTPMTVPNGSADTATFGFSNITDVISISANTEVNQITFTSAATNIYTIEADAPTLISGVGITNNSGQTQDFFIDADNGLIFSNNATAGNNVFITNQSLLRFFGRSTAGGAFTFIDSEGSTTFFDNATAGQATLDADGGNVTFADKSTADHADIATDVLGAVFFTNNSTADHATIDIGIAEAGFAEFSDSSTAGSALITVGDSGELQFTNNSTAGSATIQSTGGLISFNQSSQGGRAQIVLAFDPEEFSASRLDISGHDAPGITIGSLAGDADSLVFLGANNLTIGSNNLSTTFSGVILDGSPPFSPPGGTGGSLTKIGSGRLILSGANTYTGDTNVNGGVLQVDGSITSNTFVNRHGTLAGTGTVQGNVTNNGGVVSPGDAPGTLTVSSYTQAHSGTLLIEIAGANTGQFSVLDVLGNANLNGVLDPMLLNGFIPAIGESFTFLEYTSLTGAFSRIQNQTFDNGREHWMITYQPTFAVLTAVAGPAHVADQGSTLLLLTLGLLGVVTVSKTWPAISRQP